MFCGECGTQVSDNSKFCRSCGKPTAAPASNSVQAIPAPAPVQASPTVTVAVAPAREAEMTFLQKEGVRVTSTRFIVPGQTYAMAGVTSVRFEKVEPNRGLPFVFCFIGIIFAFLSSVRPIGFVLLLLGIVWLVCLKTKYAVALSSASGEVRAIDSTNSEYINSIVNALNEAIVYRR